jgi:hypothetical protein
MFDLIGPDGGQPATVAHLAALIRCVKYGSEAELRAAFALHAAGYSNPDNTVTVDGRSYWAEGDRVVSF